MSAFALKIIAMVTMFIDHLFASCIDPYGVDVWNISRHIVPELELHFTGLAE